MMPPADMSDSSWQSLTTVPDTLSAQVLVERLNGEGVPTRLQTDTSLLGAVRSCEILVPGELLQRARWLLSSGQFSEAELSFLATGEISPDPTDES